MSTFIDADRAAAILICAPEPSPARLAQLRSIERARADALARHNAASPLLATVSPDPGAAPAAPPLATNRAGTAPREHGEAGVGAPNLAS